MAMPQRQPGYKGYPKIKEYDKPKAGKPGKPYKAPKPPTPVKPKRYL